MKINNIYLEKEKDIITTIAGLFGYDATADLIPFSVNDPISHYDIEIKNPPKYDAEIYFIIQRCFKILHNR